MALLGIDTSGAVSVAVADGDLRTGTVRVLAEHHDERARHHDEVLTPMIDRALADAGVRRTDLTAVVAGLGPGPFTGLRVGLVTARTIAAVLGADLYGLCSLDALAHEAFAVDDVAHPDAERTDAGRTGTAPHPGRTAAVALDARRREVYHARYRRGTDGRILREEGPAVDAPADVASALRGADLLVGSGCEIYPDLLPATGPLRHVSAGHLLAAAAQQIAAGEDLSSTDPLYLREPDAARPTVRKSALGLPPR